MKIAKGIHTAYSNLTAPIHTLPNFLIIGAQKSGTTSLYEYLVKHPSIYPAIVKEPTYFAMYYHEKEGWYRSFFPLIWTKIFAEKIKHTKFITGEASTQYYWYPHTAKRVAKLIPKAKIIFLLRNPIDRTFSHYQMEYRNGNEELSFEEAIDAEEGRISNEYKKIIEDQSYFSHSYTIQAYKAKSVYANFVEKWLEYFPQEQFLFVKSEDFYQKTSETMKRIFKFLEVPNMELSEYQVFRKGTYSKLEPKMRKKLQDFFEPHNKRLYKLINTNFNWEED